MNFEKRGTKHKRNENHKRRNTSASANQVVKDRRAQLEQGARRINRMARRYMHDKHFTWHVLFVPSQKEFIAQKIISQWIERRNFSQHGLQVNDAPFACVYLPLNARWRRESRFSRKKRRFALPIIPGCIFFGAQNSTDCWYELLKLHIVFGVMSIADEPVRISGNELENFIIQNRQEIENQLAHPHNIEPIAFAVGDKANVAGGPFEGTRVDIQTIKGQNAKILLELLGANHEVEIALSNLRSVP